MREETAKVARYTIGLLHRMGKTNSNSWVDHILKAEYIYGPSGERMWGKTLCGRRGSMRNPPMLLSYEEMVTRAADVTALCGSCRRVAKSMGSWAFEEVHP